MCTHDGELAPYMLIFSGTTDKVHASVVLPPKGCVYTHTPNHWANEETTLMFVNQVIVPFIQAKRLARKEAEKADESLGVGGECGLFSSGMVLYRIKVRRSSKP
jgi:hypothetical protein